MNENEYWISRSCPPYRMPTHPPGTPGYRYERGPYRAELIYRGHRMIGHRPERRHTFRRNLLCWLLRIERRFTRPWPMYGAPL